MLIRYLTSGLFLIFVGFGYIAHVSSSKNKVIFSNGLLTIVEGTFFSTIEETIPLSSIDTVKIYKGKEFRIKTREGKFNIKHLDKDQMKYLFENLLKEMQSS